MRIIAIVLDGFHKGHTVQMDYMPTLKLIKPRKLTVDYCCDGDMTVDNPIASYVEYRECFRAVDQNVVLYSEKGESRDFLSWFNKEATGESWNEYTTLYFGYHNEPVERKQDGTQKTEYDRGFERGGEEKRKAEARGYSDGHKEGFYLGSHVIGEFKRRIVKVIEDVNWQEEPKSAKGKLEELIKDG